MTGSGKIMIETERPIIREMVPSDIDALCKMMCDEEVMQAAYETKKKHRAGLTDIFKDMRNMVLDFGPLS